MLCAFAAFVVAAEFVVAELVSIQKFREALKNGGEDEWHSDRTDELGELENELFMMSFKKSA